MAKKKQELSPEERLAAALVPEEEQPYQLPEGWKWVRLGSIAEIVRGGSPRPIKSFLTAEDNGVNWIKIGDGERYGKYISSTAQKIIPAGMSKSRFVHSGTLLLSNSMSFGRPYILKIDGCIHDGWLAIFDYEDVFNQNYLYYLLCSPLLYNQFVSKAAGAVVQNLNKDKVKASLVPLPPLSEQERIVARIESLFAKLDAAKEKVQSVLDAHEARKAALLHDAFAGKLTAKWRTEHGVASNSWYTDTLKNLCEKITDGTHHSPPNSDKGDYMYVTAKNIKETGINLENITYVSSAVHEEIYKRCDVQKGDVLYIKDGATTGIATVNTLDEPFSLLSSVAVLRPHEERLLSGYLKHLLNSSEQKSKMLNNMSGNAITRLTLSKLKATSIRVCSLSEQRQIVDILDRLLGREETVRQSAESVLESIDRMKQSILARAFRGEL